MNGKSVLRAVALTLIGLFFLFPLFWVVLMSFMTNADILRNPPSPFFSPTFHNYVALVSGQLVTTVGTQKIDYMLNLFNSTVLSGCSVILSLILGVPAAYAAQLYLRLEQLHLRPDPRIVVGSAGEGGGARLRHRLRHRVRTDRRGAGVFHRADAGAGDVHPALPR